MENKRYYITNLRPQPVELHLPGGVLVLEPRGYVEVMESDLSTPQLVNFLKRRLIQVRQQNTSKNTSPNLEFSNKTKTNLLEEIASGLEAPSGTGAESMFFDNTKSQQAKRTD